MKTQRRSEKEIFSRKINHNQETDVDRILLVDFAVGMWLSNFFEVSSLKSRRCCRFPYNGQTIDCIDERRVNRIHLFPFFEKLPFTRRVTRACGTYVTNITIQRLHSRVFSGFRLKETLDDKFFTAFAGLGCK